MSIHAIITATVLIGVVGLLVALFLSLASKAFAVPVDEREARVLEELPGANCGGCGFSGCAACASAIVSGDAPVTACTVGKKPVADKIAAIMGTAAVSGVRKVAYVRCIGDCEKTFERYIYSGPRKCGDITAAPGRGPKSCPYGCVGCGDCARVCLMGAISIQKGIAVVDEEKCVDCRRCMKACPKGVIYEVPYGAASHISCSGPEKGKIVMENCKVGCISCRKCVKNCPEGAISFEKGYPEIHYDKCTNCGTCRDGCPRHCIL